MKPSVPPSVGSSKPETWQLVVSVAFVILVVPALLVPLVFVALVALPAIGLAFPFFVASSVERPAPRRVALAPRRPRSVIDTTNPVPSQA